MATENFTPTPVSGPSPGPGDAPSTAVVAAPSHLHLTSQFPTSITPGKQILTLALYGTIIRLLMRRSLIPRTISWTFRAGHRRVRSRQAACVRIDVVGCNRRFGRGGSLSRCDQRTPLGTDGSAGIILPHRRGSSPAFRQATAGCILRLWHAKLCLTRKTKAVRTRVTVHATLQNHIQQQ
jgi:hypothetical protein